MIFDSIGHLQRYDIPYRSQIIAFLQQNDPSKIALGETEILGRELFVRTAEYETRPLAQGKFEAHRLYMDLQYVVSGVEQMLYAPADLLSPLTSYDEAGDYQFFKVARDASSFIVRSDEFAVFWPGEAHCPSCSVGDAVGLVKKIVFKVRVP